MVALLGVALTAQAADPAPELEVTTWIARGPAEAAPVTVVEVWATWCGPCHETFPVLSSLQEAYGDQVRVVAVTDESARTARRFFHDHAEQMRFAVGVAPEETVRALLFGGFGGRGIPSVYLIRDGTMLWSGEPKALEAALVQQLGPPSPAAEPE